MRRLALLLGLSLLVVLSVGFMTTHAQDDDLYESDDPPFTCPNPAGEFYQAGLFPRYDAASGNFVLADTATNDIVRVIEPVENNIRIIDWSPNCRYLTGAVGVFRAARFHVSRGAVDSYVRWDGTRTIVIWDTLTGERAGVVNDHIGIFLYEHETVLWSANSQYAIILGGCYKAHIGCEHERVRIDHIWNQTTGRITQFASRERSRYSSGTFNQILWDLPNNRIWSSGRGGAVVYDLSTAQEMTYYPNIEANTYLDSRFNFSPDGSKLIVYTIAYHNTYSPNRGITVYDLVSGEPTIVNAGSLGAPYIPRATYHPVALSEDNRYLIAGYEVIRVWDIQNLPEAVDERLPIYRHGGPEARIWSARFVDWGVIETTSSEGTQKWDLHTGAYIP